jgi:hypothetical protein
VNELTTLLLLRVRYLLQQPEARPLLSEEVLVLGFVEEAATISNGSNAGEALRLLAEAKPDANIQLAEKRRAGRAGAREPWRMARRRVASGA